MPRDGHYWKLVVVSEGGRINNIKGYGGAKCDAWLHSLVPKTSPAIEIS